MSLLQSFFKRKAEDRAAGSGYRFFFGQSTAGKAVNERTAMQMTAVYACVRIWRSPLPACLSTSTKRDLTETGLKRKTIRSMPCSMMSRTRR